jgi:hypothetical protein
MATSLQRLEIPQSSSTVDIYIIDNGASFSGLPGSSMMDLFFQVMKKEVECHPTPS